MAKTYLENRIMSTLEDIGLIKNSRTPINYKTPHKGQTYRKIRKFAVNNAASIGLGALAIGGGIVAYKPDLATEVATTFGVVGGIGLIGRMILPLDEYLYHNAANDAKRAYRNNIAASSWRTAYDDLKIKKVSQLDTYVYMAQTAEAITSEYPHQDDQISLGISIAKIAETLSETRNGQGVRGISLQRELDMLSRQKIPDPEDNQKIMDYFNMGLPHGYTAMNLRRFRKGKSVPGHLLHGLEAIARTLDNYEFGLRIDRVDNAQSVAAQLSRGLLTIDNSVGPNACSYMGMHTLGGIEFPRVVVRDDTAHSFMTHSYKGIGIVTGNAEHGVLDDATGGIAIIEGRAENNFAHNATDKNFPLVGYSVDGIDTMPEEGEVGDGVVVSLNKHQELPDRAIGLRFKEGKIIEKVYFEGDHMEIQAADFGVKYLQEWADKHKTA